MVDLRLLVNGDYERPLMLYWMSGHAWGFQSQQATRRRCGMVNSESFQPLTPPSSDQCGPIDRKVHDSLLLLLLLYMSKSI